MDEARRTVLLSELEDAKKERDRLNVYIETLSLRLGVEAGSSAPAAEDPTPTTTQGGLPATDDPVSLVYANEFYGQSMPKAAEAVLRRWSPEPHHRPIRTPMLLQALQKGGLNISETRALYRSLWSSPRFAVLKGGQWGLAEWYPKGTKSKGKNDEAASASDEPAPAAEQAEPKSDAQEPTGGSVTDLLSQSGESDVRVQEVAS